ncbi:transcription factor bHLH35 [Lathyrus oleraceus]|uniref:transcription factor bHLH35 n=1 Tax=Pisum sativum TaxID=3888 RepID=UPI0021CEA8B5|nr:transcription factor bHLH35-like [Pisum sativum]
MSHASKTCTEKKIRLKSLIKALTKEDIDGNMASDMEEESGEKDENVDSDDATDEETYVVLIQHVIKFHETDLEYIEHLHEQEKNLEAEIMELQSGMPNNNITQNYDFDQELLVLLRSKKKRTDRLYDSVSSTNSPIQLLELRVTYMGENTIVVSLTCSKRTDTMVKLCEVFESLNLKIITANITCFSGTLLKTVFIQANEEDKDLLQIKIQRAIAALNDPLSPMSI